MNKLEDLIGFAEGVKDTDWSELKVCMESKDPTKKDMIPFYSYRIGIFKDIAKALTLFKEIIYHLDIEVDYTDTDFNDIIHGYYFKLKFDNNDDKDFQTADELYEWYENETYNDEYYEEYYKEE